MTLVRAESPGKDAIVGRQAIIHHGTLRSPDDAPGLAAGSDAWAKQIRV